MAAGNPEIIYGVQLLDDLHNYFPDLLYNNQRFTTVQSVLQYLTQSTRRRFDLFSYGRTQYNNSVRNVIRRNESDNKQNDEDEDEDDNEDDGEGEGEDGQGENENTAAAPVRGASPVQQSAPAPVPASQHRVQRSYASVLGGGTGQQSLYSLLPTLDNLIYTTIPPIQYVPDTGVQIDANMSLLSAIAGFFPSNGQLSRSFLDPVPVAPTVAQIQAASTVRTLDADMEDNCSICQDTMRGGEAIRRINVCSHTFHRSCIDTWFVRNVRCPVCRHDIRDAAATPAPAAPAPAPASENTNDGPRMDEVE